MTSRCTVTPKTEASCCSSDVMKAPISCVVERMSWPCERCGG
jgi:hypothetical protein